MLSDFPTISLWGPNLTVNHPWFFLLTLCWDNWLPYPAPSSTSCLPPVGQLDLCVSSGTTPASFLRLQVLRLAFNEFTSSLTLNSPCPNPLSHLEKRSLVSYGPMGSWISGTFLAASHDLVLYYFETCRIWYWTYTDVKIVSQHSSFVWYSLHFPAN